MQGFVVRGVPPGLRRDAWWMAPDAARGSAEQVSGASRPDAPGRLTVVALAVLALVILADALLWQVWAPRLSLGVFAVVAMAAAHLALGPRPSTAVAAQVWGGVALGVAAVVEEVQALSLLFLMAAMLHGFARLGLGSGRGLGRAMARMPFVGLWQDWQDGRAIVAATAGARPGRAGLVRLLRDWLPAAVLGSLFLMLLGLGNPVLDGWMLRLFRWSPEVTLPAERIAFWLFLATALWPTLRLSEMRSGLAAPRVPMGFHAPALLDPRSVARALMTFNLLFAVQSATDIAYLWGGVRLPEGMTYAEYAHRGAYPLLATAILAGAFGLAAGRHVVGQPALRVLLLVWVGQNILLMGSSVLRLDLYVESYGLTRLRFAAFVWMGLVAAGLVLMIWQIGRGRSAGWLVRRSAALAALTLYLCCFINVAGVVARSQIARGPEATDAYYVCTALGEGALPAIYAEMAQSGEKYCPYAGPIPFAAPTDWREWGFRNWRVGRSVAAYFDWQPGPAALPDIGLSGRDAASPSAAEREASE